MPESPELRVTLQMQVMLVETKLRSLHAMLQSFKQMQCLRYTILREKDVFNPNTSSPHSQAAHTMGLYTNARGLELKKDRAGADKQLLQQKKKPRLFPHSLLRYQLRGQDVGYLRLACRGLL